VLILNITALFLVFVFLHRLPPGESPAMLNFLPTSVAPFPHLLFSTLYSLFSILCPSIRSAENSKKVTFIPLANQPSLMHPIRSTTGKKGLILVVLGLRNNPSLINQPLKINNHQFSALIPGPLLFSSCVYGLCFKYDVIRITFYSSRTLKT
jgi:hypothetical protein